MLKRIGLRIAEMSSSPSNMLKRIGFRIVQALAPMAIPRTIDAPKKIIEKTFAPGTVVLTPEEVQQVKNVVAMLKQTWGDDELSPYIQELKQKQNGKALDDYDLDLLQMNQNPSKARKVIFAVVESLQKRGYAAEVPLGDEYPVFCNQVGKFLCNSTAFFFLGNYTSAMLIYRPLISVDTIMEMKRNADLIIRESRVVSVQMFVGGDSIQDEARSLAKCLYVQLVEKDGSSYRIVD